MKEFAARVKSLSYGITFTATNVQYLTECLRYASTSKNKILAGGFPVAIIRLSDTYLKPQSN
jgi:hypothetical protein